MGSLRRTVPARSDLRRPSLRQAYGWWCGPGSHTAPVDGWSEPGDGHLCRMLDGEPVAYRCCLPAVKRQLPGELAQVITLGRIRAGLPQPHLDIAVGGHRDVVMNADPGLVRAVIFHRDLVGDVDRAGAPDHGLARAPAAQLAFHPDLVIHAEL